jgi:hypothetical protein
MHKYIYIELGFDLMACPKWATGPFVGDRILLSMS